MAKAKTQQILALKDIREGVIVLSNNTLRGIIMTSSTNFALKSEDAQKAIIFNFQDFLNSLDFPLQIIVQSRRLNITGYLEKLEELGNEEENELLQMQIKEYHDYIKELIAGRSIMSKRFFVVVPYSFGELPGLMKEEKEKMKKSQKSLSERRFQRAKSQLWQRMEFVSLGLRRCGLECTPLNTAEIIELFWSLYHPKEAEVGYYPEIPPELTR